MMHAMPVDALNKLMERLSSRAPAASPFDMSQGDRSTSNSLILDLETLLDETYETGHPFVLDFLQLRGDMFSAAQKVSTRMKKEQPKLF